jgi:hypothetical protein
MKSADELQLIIDHISSPLESCWREVLSSPLGDEFFKASVHWPFVPLQCARSTEEELLQLILLRLCVRRVKNQKVLIDQASQFVALYAQPFLSVKVSFEKEYDVPLRAVQSGKGLARFSIGPFNHTDDIILLKRIGYSP